MEETQVGGVTASEGLGGRPAAEVGTSSVGVRVCGQCTVARRTMQGYRLKG